MSARKKAATYNELYFLYHEYVVLMLKTYMYTAYDDSARVLSYLMDYKLVDGHDGLYCAGPDKEKISKVLSDHHVNHVISEYGKITKIACFDDNHYETYFELGKGSSAVVMPSTANKATAGPTPIKETYVQPPVIIPDWLYVGCRIIHKILGCGVITSVADKRFSASFDSGETKTFVNPDSFGFFRSDDQI